MDYYKDKSVGLSWDFFGCLGFRVQGSGFRIGVSIMDMGAILRLLYGVTKHMSQRQLRLFSQNNVADS